MTDAATDHEFGSSETDLKLSMIGAYLKHFNTALRKKYPALWYIDAFAGTGVRTVKHEAQELSLFGESVEAHTEDRIGSARIAINTKPAFDRLIFIDLRLKHYKALLALRRAHAERDIEVIRGNANDIILRMVTENKWTRTRAVLFLDPYGLQVDWTTLEAIRRTGAIDVWYLVSLEGLFRQAAHNHRKVTPTKRASLTRMLGTPDWEKDWYSPAGQRLLDGGEDHMHRSASVTDISNYVLARLRGLFPAVLDPIRLRNKKGGPAFALFFAMSNPDPKAIAVATRIAGYILSSGMASQV